MRLHHAQVSMPAGGEGEARAFYVDVLGLVEVAKPPPLDGRGGCWFRACAADGSVSAELHLGVEEPFRPARKAHPALEVEDVEGLDALADRLRAGGFVPDLGERDTFPGYVRVHVADPFGNRVEVLAPR
jgi:catechol 2,3-dioxygenase-like lactoylglutathione lyase family enzyme